MFVLLLIITGIQMPGCEESSATLWIRMICLFFIFGFLTSCITAAQIIFEKKYKSITWFIIECLIVIVIFSSLLVFIMHQMRLVGLLPM